MSFTQNEQKLFFENRFETLKIKNTRYLLLHPKPKMNAHFSVHPITTLLNKMIATHFLTHLRTNLTLSTPTHTLTRMTTENHLPLASTKSIASKSNPPEKNTTITNTPFSKQIKSSSLPEFTGF